MCVTSHFPVGNTFVACAYRDTLSSKRLLALLKYSSRMYFITTVYMYATLMFTHLFITVHIPSLSSHTRCDVPYEIEAVYGLTVLLPRIVLEMKLQTCLRETCFVETCLLMFTHHQHHHKHAYMFTLNMFRC